MFDEESALVGGVGSDDSCGRRKILGGKGRKNSSVKGMMDDLRCIGIRCRWTTVERVDAGW